MAATLEGGGSSQQMSPAVCTNMMMVTALVYPRPVQGKRGVKELRRDTLLEGADEDTDKFGPLKIILQSASAILTDRKVRLQLPYP
jgi:hypothetical protein